MFKKFLETVFTIFWVLQLERYEIDWCFLPCLSFQIFNLTMKKTYPLFKKFVLFLLKNFKKRLKIFDAFLYRSFWESTKSSKMTTSRLFSHFPDNNALEGYLVIQCEPLLLTKNPHMTPFPSQTRKLETGRRY